jgi:tetratricopeptide (TPR) repeat protein
MKKISFFLILVFLICGLANAQTWKGKGRVKGTVKDEQGNPIEGIRVKFYSPKAQGGTNGTSDDKGQWSINWIRSGSWDVDFEKLGYEAKRISVHISEFKRNPDVNIVLKKVEGIIISAELEAKLTEGNQLFEQGQYEEARALYEAMLVEYPDAYIVHMNIGNCYFEQERYDEAVAAYEKVLEFDAESIGAKLSIGNSYANAGEPDKSLEWYNAIPFEEIEDPVVLFNIGANYYNLAKFQDALRYYQRSVEVKEDYLDGLYQLGLTRLNLQQNAEAIQAFEKYLTFDAETERATQVRGFIEYLKR